MLLGAQGQKDVEDARPDELIVPVLHEEVGKHIQRARKPQEGLVVSGRVEEKGEDEAETTADKVDVGHTPVAGLHRVDQNSHSVLLDEESLALIVLRNDVVEDVDARNQSSKASGALKGAERGLDLDFHLPLGQSSCFSLCGLCGSGWFGGGDCRCRGCLGGSSWLCARCCFA